MIKTLFYIYIHYTNLNIPQQLYFIFYDKINHSFIILYFKNHFLLILNLMCINSWIFRSQNIRISYPSKPMAILQIWCFLILNDFFQKKNFFIEDFFIIINNDNNKISLYHKITKFLYITQCQNILNFMAKLSGYE